MRGRPEMASTTCPGRTVSPSRLDTEVTTCTGKPASAGGVTDTSRSATTVPRSISVLVRIRRSTAAVSTVAGDEPKGCLAGCICECLRDLRLGYLRRLLTRKFVRRIQWAGQMVTLRTHATSPLCVNRERSRVGKEPVPSGELQLLRDFLWA